MASDLRQALEVEGIEEQILAFVRRELVAPDAVVTRDQDLLSGELLDSLGVLRLSAFVRETFALAMRPGDFVAENFRTVAVLAAYVHTSSAAGRPPADADR